jgi:cytochrome c-type biogenesis protein CcmH
VPVVVFVLAIAVTAWLINRWKGRHMLLVANGAPVAYATPDNMRDRIRRDTEY